MAMALHCHLALLKTKENNGDMKKKIQQRKCNYEIKIIVLFYFFKDYMIPYPCIFDLKIRYYRQYQNLQIWNFCSKNRNYSTHNSFCGYNTVDNLYLST